MLQLPITWLGTKVTMRGVLLPLLASIPRKLYVEPFVGAGGLFFGKPQEAAEVINDRNRALVNLFKMMREPIVAADMQALLLQTAPCARSVYNELAQLVAAYLKGLDIKEHKRAASLADYSNEFAAAFAFFYVQNTTFAGAGLLRGFGGGAKGNDAARIIGGYARARERLPLYAERLESVCIEELDALECVRKYDHSTTLFFIDPPYNCASSANYKLDWTIDNERELVALLCEIQGAFVLTCYDTPIYQELLQAGAQRFEVEKQTTVPTSRDAMTARCEVVYYKRANCDIIGDTATTGGNYGAGAQLRLF